MRICVKSKHPNKCDGCGRKLGLVVHRFQNFRFHSAACKERWHNDRLIEANKRWKKWLEKEES